MIRLDIFFFLSLAAPLIADHPESSDKGPAPGHSMHAQAFNEGPRQAAYLMQGMGNTSFAISTKNPMAQRFFDQGISQLHGFWYYEAERSFRQAASIDPDHPMHYWGMARANIENEERSRGFIEQAAARLEKANDKERRLIEAWQLRVKAAPNSEPEEKKPLPSKKKSRNPKKSDERDRKQKQDRLKKYMEDLDALAVDYPKDIEIKAMVVLQAWQNMGEDIPIQSFSAIDAMLSEIFQANPRHPAHHFRIHLWNYKKDELALQSAAMCGPAAPGIAHMWHMPGHTYSRLKRYHDAAWQQEASARVDHAHMMRDQILPDQIHNYAHNNEWLIRTLNLTGQVSRAVELAKNMIELPRHPRYNMLDERGSAHYGRERLLQTLTNYGLWDQLLALSETFYFSEEADQTLNDERLGWRAISAIQLGQKDVAMTNWQELQSIERSLREQIRVDEAALRSAKEAKELEKESDEFARPPKLDGPFPFSDDLFGQDDDPSLPVPLAKAWKSDDATLTDEQTEIHKRNHENRYRLQKLVKWLSAVESVQLASEGQFEKALRTSHFARSILPSLLRIQWLSETDQKEKALSKLEDRIRDAEGELLPHAVATFVHSKFEGHEQRTKEILEKLAPIAAQADEDLEVLLRLKPLVEQFELGEKWRTKPSAASDLGERPRLDALGPFRWQPSPAPMWHGVQPDGTTFTSMKLAGKPYVLVMYLGFGCLHCAEQLAVFSPKAEEFRKLGIEMIAISTENPTQLKEGLKNYDKVMNFSLLSNVERDIFKAFRAFDDFEGLALHGTFLVDKEGFIRWQDIGYEPFMDVDFLIGEAKRLGVKY